MTDDFSYPPPEEQTNPDEAAIVGWVRWWHWLIFVALIFTGFLYYPLWRFDQKWKQLKVGDSLERVKQLLGDPGKASYTVQGTGASGTDDAYVYTRYWKTYEVLISTSTQRVTGKTVIGGSSQPAPQSQAPAKKR